MLERCFNEEEIEEIEFKQWTTTDRSSLQTIVQSTDKFIESFLDKLETPIRDDFIAKQQFRYLAKRKESLKEGEFLVIRDFSGNFSFFAQDEVQSFHWHNGMVTLHPFVYYHKDEGQICHGNFVLISDCNTHDTVAVHLFQHCLINQPQKRFQFVSNVVYFSDGCAGQYKHLKNFLNLCLHEEDFDIPAEWHFFVTSHGKGPSDGIRGNIKREATKASLQPPYKDQILTALDLFYFVESSLNGINAEFLTCTDWQTEEDLLRERFSIAKTIAGI